MRSMRAVADTSVIVGAVLEGSDGQDACISALHHADAAAAGHAWFESFSVLTRLPPDVRLAADDAHRVVSRTVNGVRLLSVSEQRSFQRWLAAGSIAGGAVYDGLVGWVAKVAGVPLITRDVRALAVYRSLGIELLVIDPPLL